MPTPIKYDKLVRDRVIEIIEADGHEPSWEIMDSESYAQALRAKLIEETAEYMMRFDPAELVDILEVVYCLAASQHEILPDELHRLQTKKRLERGSLHGGIRLRSIGSRSTTTAEEPK